MGHHLMQCDLAFAALRELRQVIGKPCAGRVLVILEIENVFVALFRGDFQAERDVAGAGVGLETVGIAATARATPVKSEKRLALLPCWKAASVGSAIASE